MASTQFTRNSICTAIDWNLSDYELGRLTVAIDLSGSFACIHVHTKAYDLKPTFQFKRAHRDQLVAEMAYFLSTAITRTVDDRLLTQKVGIDVIRLAYYAYPHLSQQRQEQIQDVLIRCRDFVEYCADGFDAHQGDGWHQLEPQIAVWARRLGE